MYKIRLNDGTEMNARFCSLRSGVLSMDVLTESSFMDIALLFSDPDKTQTIIFVYGGTQETYTNCTDLFIINGSTPGEYIISLRQI